jgi:hypothetical protein
MRLPSTPFDGRPSEKQSHSGAAQADEHVLKEVYDGNERSGATSQPR